ncbi:unnamed protein product [Linum tenue]|uniref:Autophagy-related protein 27 n=1 Tax=Linum tenue TaxID=586396 RepID=A0AAV0K5I3_9ROSI|nr:unnamed protein product [Linum tenue]
MGIRIDSLRCSLIAIPLLILASSFHSASAGPCEVSYFNGRQIFNFSLTAPIAGFPHGVLSEDGYYKVAENESVLWFQVGPIRTVVGHLTVAVDVVHLLPIISVAMMCAALLAVFLALLLTSWGPLGLQKSGTCDYAAVLQHPSGCATVVSVHGKGLGWFATLIIIVLCVFGAYMLAGAVYRHFFLGIHGFDVMPNLDFWITLPQRTQGFFASLVRRFRGPTESYRDSYSPVNF